MATTGSGRYLTADFIGADLVRNEITAQAEAAISIDPEVDTIFEIGGQDSKYISIDNGVIVDFEMNKACAAGTGSFLEEQAERLGISIKDEFSALAFQSRGPTKMGERCTVFIESDVMHHQQSGSKTDDIVAGLCYSIVLNYLNKVVGDRRVGKKIFFQGGTAFNKGVVAAFEKVCGKPITVPSHHDVTGAIGAAILAMKEKTWEKSGFKGFDLSKRRYDIDTFECKGCENLCEIRKVTCEGETPLYYGSRCEKYDVVRRAKLATGKDLFKLRGDLLHDTYKGTVDGEVIGIPKILNMHELLPFWRSFLTELGFSVVLSDSTNTKIIKEGVENIIVESCFPIKLAHGHILNMMDKGIKRLFMPSIISLRKQSEGVLNSFACPYAQSLPYTSRASIDFESVGVKVHSPVVYFGRGPKVALDNLTVFGKTLGKSKKAGRGCVFGRQRSAGPLLPDMPRRGVRFSRFLKAGREGDGTRRQAVQQHGPGRQPERAQEALRPRRRLHPHRHAAPRRGGGGRRPEGHVLGLRTEDTEGGQDHQVPSQPLRGLYHQLRLRSRLLHHPFLQEDHGRKALPPAGDRRAQRRRRAHHPPGGLSRQHQEREGRD